jgi:hypothetical protein
MLPNEIDSSTLSAPSSAQQSLKMLRCNKRSRHSRGPSSVGQDALARQSSPLQAPCQSLPLPRGAPHQRRHWLRPIFTKIYPRRLRVSPPRRSGAAAAPRSAASHPCIPSRYPTFSLVQRSNHPLSRRISTRRSTPTTALTISALRRSEARESLRRSTHLRTRIRSR